MPFCFAWFWLSTPIENDLPPRPKRPCTPWRAIRHSKPWFIRIILAIRVILALQGLQCCHPLLDLQDLLPPTTAVSTLNWVLLLHRLHRHLTRQASALFWMRRQVFHECHLKGHKCPQCPHPVGHFILMEVPEVAFLLHHCKPCHLDHLVGHLVGHLGHLGHLDRWWVAWVAHKVCKDHKDLLQLMVTLGCIALWSFQSFWMCPLRVACSGTRQKPINFVLWITKGKNWRAVKRFKALTILKRKAWLLRLFQSLKSWAYCMPRLCQRQSRFRPDLWKESMYPCCIAEAGLGVFKSSPTLATLTSFVLIGLHHLCVTFLVVDRRCRRQLSWIPGFWIHGPWPCLPVMFLELWLESSYMEHWLDAGRIILLIFHWYFISQVLWCLIRCGTLSLCVF